MTRPSWEAERRSVDRRVGLPDSRPPGDRADRRQALLDRRARADRRTEQPANRALTDREEQRRLVLYLAADTARTEWLRRFVARHLEAAADALERQRNPAGAETVRGIAERTRSDEGSLW